jgi:lactoylglutathione lyase
MKMRIDFVTIQTKDLKASIEFYTKNLRFKVERQFTPGPGIQIVFLNDNHGNKLEFIQNENEKPFSGEGISIGFYVEDIEAVEKDLKSKGIKIESGPVTLGSGVKLMNIKDNNGLVLGFVQDRQ